MQPCRVLLLPKCLLGIINGNLCAYGKFHVSNRNISKSSGWAYLNDLCNIAKAPRGTTFTRRVELVPHRITAVHCRKIYVVDGRIKGD